MDIFKKMSFFNDLASRTLFLAAFFVLDCNALVMHRECTCNAQGGMIMKGTDL
jgi:hypothetical protein